MTTIELENLDKNYPYKAITSGVAGSTRFDNETQAREYFNNCPSSCLLSSYINGVYKVLAYKYKIKPSV